jgi:hypothetical protein
MAGSCEHGNETSASGTTELVSYWKIMLACPTHCVKE